MDDRNHEMFSVILPLFLQPPPQIGLFQEENVDADNKYALSKRIRSLAVFRFIIMNTPTRRSLTWTNLGIYATSKLVSATSER